MTRKSDASLAGFAVRLKAAGGEILGATNPYEVLRFRTSLGVGVIYAGKRGETWNAEAIAARKHLDANKGSLAPVDVKGRRRDKSTVNALLKRDGDTCFFCGDDLAGDITVEHLVPIAHGGPNHVSNLVLAHALCNQKAGHLSVAEKVRLAIEARRS
jgi:5-methylcytosine-specific restriction endonuclease McrA